MKHEPDFVLTDSPAVAHGELLNPGNSRRYLLVSPCRDEAQYLRRTLDSVALQSVPPALWLVVDDGSTDETAAILEEYSRRLPYLRVIRRNDRGGRQVGPGVIEAFYAGLDEVRIEDFDYLCKLDMDLDLPVRYFEILMERMESNPRIGTSSLYYLAVAAYRLPAHPALIGSIAMLWGYLRSWLKRLPRYDDPEFRRFVRSYQHACLLLGKRAATARVEAERAHLWHKRHPTLAGDEAAAKNRQRAELL